MVSLRGPVTIDVIITAVDSSLQPIFWRVLYNLFSLIIIMLRFKVVILNYPTWVFFKGKSLYLHTRSVIEPSFESNTEKVPNYKSLIEIFYNCYRIWVHLMYIQH